MVARFERGNGELDSVAIDNGVASGRIYLLGANVTDWKPTNSAPVLWLSKQSSFTPGKAIRGGIPICLPWFGANKTDPKAPQHGFARTKIWELVSVEDGEKGGMNVLLRLTTPELEVRYTVSMSGKLDLALEVKNRATKASTFEAAFHTYFAVSDVREVKVTGLEGARYFDKLDGGKVKVQEDAIEIRAETDRVYADSQATCVLHDPGFGRRVLVKKSNSNTTIVWNPWIAKAKTMADFGDDEWTEMICIETANAGADAVTLDPGASHVMRATVEVEPL